MFSLVKMTLAFVVWLAASIFVLSQPSLQSVADASIEITLPDGPISVGGLAILKCTVSGAVEVSNFTWHYNGTLIMEQQDPLITIEHDKNVGTLSIHEIPINEAGNYTCMAYASNDSTSLQVSYMLDLQVTPRVTAEPRQFALLGNEGSLSCVVTGNPLPVLTWRINGTIINSNVNERYSVPMLGTLKIANTTAKDAGVYECTASSSKGTDAVNFTLTVLTIPVIQSQPSISVKAGMQAILHCHATGIDTPTISWISGGLNVGISNGSRLRSYTNGSLVIANAEVLDDGRYTCIATNRAGSTNFTITLNVTGPPVLLVPPKDTIVKAGNTAILHCSFFANPSNARIQWQGIDSNVLTTSDKYTILDNGTLIIRDTTDKDNGEYQCNVTNSRGNSTAKANLTVINQPYTPRNFQQNGTTGAQTFTVSWYAPDLSNTTRPVRNYLIVLSLVSDGQQIKNSTTRVPHNQTNHTLTDLIPGSEYKVLIAAQNQVGTSNYSDPLHIETPATVPALEYFTVTQAGTDEAKLIFLWRVKYDGGHDIINFAIQYQRVLDASEDAWTSLFTRGLDENMETYKPESLPPPGNYVFRAVIGNMLGDKVYNDTSEINISEAIPGQPSKPEASEVTRDSVTLDFDLVFMGTGLLNQFVVKVTGSSEKTQKFATDDSINSSSNVTVRVDGLEAGSTYRFQVAAMNDIGIGPFSEMSNEITTEKDGGTFVYIIVGAVGGFVIIVTILLVTLFVCYMCNRRMKAHKHQISINGMPEKTKVQTNQDSSDATDDGNGFIPHFDKPLPKYTQYNSGSTILSPIERSRSLQYRNESFGPASSTISYGSSVATRTASLLHSKPNNNYMTPRGQMYNSATMINYGGGSQCNTMDGRRWSPPTDFSQRERRSPSSTYHSDTIGRITNMATDV